MFNKKTVKDVDLKDKKVLVRVDYNVLNDEGNITEDYRLKATLPTIQYLVDQNCRIILASHAGRPEGKRVPTLSLRPVAEKLGELLTHGIKFVDDCVGAAVKNQSQ